MAERKRAVTRGGYARAVERQWRRLGGGEALFSPRDWSRIASWFERGVPLGVIEEVLREAGRTRRHGRAGSPRLAALDAAVDEAWSAVRAGRLAAAVPPRAKRAGTSAHWRRRAALEPEGSPLARLIEELLARHATGGSAGAVDAELDRRLAATLPPAVAERVRREVDAELAPYRCRMTPARLEQTRERAAVERARRLLGLPRLAGDGSRG